MYDDDVIQVLSLEDWIELIDHFGSVAAEDSDQTSYWTDQKQNGYPDGRLPAMDWRILT